jgi:hypothetical protein
MDQPGSAPAFGGRERLPFVGTHRWLQERMRLHCCSYSTKSRQCQTLNLHMLPASTLALDLDPLLAFLAGKRFDCFPLCRPQEFFDPPSQSRRRPKAQLSWLVVETPGTIFTMNIMKVHALQSHATAVHLFRDIFRTLDIPRVSTQAYHTHNKWIKIKLLIVMCHSEIFNC